MPPTYEPIIGVPEYKVLSAVGSDPVRIEAVYEGKVSCPRCSGERLRKKDLIWRGS